LDKNTDTNFVNKKIPPPISNASPADLSCTVMVTDTDPPKNYINYGSLCFTN
jgi:hypothetical protein